MKKILLFIAAGLIFNLLTPKINAQYRIESLSKYVIDTVFTEDGNIIISIVFIRSHQQNIEHQLHMLQMDQWFCPMFPDLIGVLDALQPLEQ
ncbi:MAG: hypothetical protein R2764_15050 [Bacteroidales bacterium]